MPLKSRVHAAAFIVSLLEENYFSEAEEFVEWYLETFDTDLSDMLRGVELGGDDA